VQRIINRAPKTDEVDGADDGDFSACSAPGLNKVYKIPARLEAPHFHAEVVLHEMIHTILYHVRPSLWEDEDFVAVLAKGMLEALTSMK